MFVLLDSANAGGGINHKMTVENPTQWTVRVKAWKKTADLNLVAVNDSWTVVPPGSSKTFETGSLCPSYFSGEVKTPEGWRKMKSRSCLGIDFEGDPYSSTAGGHSSAVCCWNVTVEVCLKLPTSQDNKEIGFKQDMVFNDYDVGFCK